MIALRLAAPQCTHNQKMPHKKEHQEIRQNLLELACSKNSIAEEAKRYYTELVQKKDVEELYIRSHEFIEKNKQYLNHTS